MVTRVRIFVNLDMSCTVYRHSLTVMHACLRSRHMVVCHQPRKMCGTQVYFSPHIFVITGSISIKFSYISNLFIFITSIYTTLHTKF